MKFLAHGKCSLTVAVNTIIIIAIIINIII